MVVSLKGEDRNDVRRLVEAVVDAYMKEIADYDHSKRTEQIRKLEEMLLAKSDEIRKKQTEYRNLAAQLKTADPQALSTKQQITIQQYGAMRGELARVQSEIRRAQAELKSQQGYLASTEGDSKAYLSQAELTATLASDPIYRQIMTGISQANLERVITESAAGAGPMSARYKRGSDDLGKALQAQLQSRYNELRQEMRDNTRARAEIEVKKLQGQLADLKLQEEQVRSEVKVVSDAAEALGNSSVELDVLRDDIRQAKEVGESVNRQVEQLKLEGRSAPRIEAIQKAAVPEVANQTLRIALAVFASLAGLLIPVGLIVSWDASAQRVNSSAELNRELGLDVFGVVPLVPTRAMRHMASADHRYSNWRALVCESVDGIAARLLHVAEFERTQVVMVSSAAGGEGKTVLATQLAMSLARTGHRTLLVDFDLRRPAIDKVFKLPLGPGVSEALRGEAEVHEAIHETATQNLSVMTAGAWNARLLTMLAGGITESLFAALRSQYEFIVVDGCPILPVADARFVSQHVDGVILAVLRDVSRAPKIRTACRILSALGVRMLGAVVAESAANGDYSDSRYYQGFRTMVVKSSGDEK